MDLTSLSSNLPRNHPSSSEEPPETGPSMGVLLSSFKGTALSVTNLFKAASEQIERSHRDGRTEGYQDCLEEVLYFLEKIEGRCDPKTLEMLRQWTLSRRRKLGTVGRPRGRRDDRETSAEEDDRGMEEHVNDPLPTRNRNSSPPSHPPPRQTTRTPPRRSSPTHNRQQTPVFAFRSDMHMPRHIPSPPQRLDKMDDVELPDTDVFSPPTSPNLQSHAKIYPSSRNPSAGNNNTPRPGAGSKRKWGSLSDFFDFQEGIVQDKKLYGGNKRRHH